VSCPVHWVFFLSIAMSKGENSRAHWNFNKEKGLVDILNEHNHQRFRGAKWMGGRRVEEHCEEF
jgi:hypothetical protein